VTDQTAAQRHDAITSRLNAARGDVARLASEVAQVEAAGRDALLGGSFDPGLDLTAKADSLRVELAAAERVVTALDSVERELSAARLQDEHTAQRAEAFRLRDEYVTTAQRHVDDFLAHLSAARHSARLAQQSEDVAVEQARLVNTLSAALGLEALSRYANVDRPATRIRERNPYWSAISADGTL
jgi:hypothetical protein